MKKYKIGYTQGTFDMFHIGHLNLINHAKEQCDYLIVGINSDNLVKEYKNKIPVIPQNERLEIICNLKSVDKCILTDTLDKVKIYNKEKFNAVFIGDDWKGNERWQITKNQLSILGIDVVFLSYTQGISSTILKNKLKNRYNESEEE